MSLSSGRIVALLGTVSGVLTLFGIGISSATKILVVTLSVLSIEFIVFPSFISVGTFTLFAVSTGLFMLWQFHRSTATQAAVTDGPELLAVVPAYKEVETLGGTVRSLLANRYDTLQICLVVEPEDTPTRAKATDLAARHDAVSVQITDRPGSKAGAINTAVRRSDTEYIAVFDADEHVSPAFLPVAMATLLAGADVFQGRRIPRPTGAVETLAYCERVIVRAAYAAGELVGFTYCQSAATVFTREAFDQVGGYDDCLTEDIDFSHKCYCADLDVRRNRLATSTIEAPHTLRDLWGQRKRWRIGHVEVAHSRAEETFASDPTLTHGLSLTRALGGVIGGASLLILTAHVFTLLLHDFESALLVPYACILGLLVAVWWRDFTAGKIGLPSWSLCCFPLIYLGHGVLTIKALFEFYLTWDGEWYRVEKTGT